MSTAKVDNYQIGRSVTATNNFTWYQPASPDGTVRLGNGNAGSVTDLITVGSTGNLTFANSISLSAASTKTLTLNGGAGSNGLVIDASNNVGIGISPTSLLTTVSSGQVQIGTTAWPSSFVGKSNARTLIGNEGLVMVWNEAAAALGNAATIYIGPKGSGTNGSTIIAGGAIAGVSESSSTNNGALTFSTNGGSGNSEKMRLDSSGNLGLGVTPSTWTLYKSLELGRTGNGISGYISGSSVTINANAYYNSGWKYANSAVASQYEQDSGLHKWYTSTNTPTANGAITFNPAMTLDASGRLIVGGTTPYGGVATFTGGSSPVIINQTSSTGYAGLRIYNDQGSNIRSLELDYSGSAYSGSLINGGPTGESAAICTTGAYPLVFGTNNTARATIDSSGALTVPNIYSNTTASVTYVAVSSAGLLQRGGVSALKYKQDIRDLESIDITKFRPVRYKSKCENDDQTIDYFGFIADEVEEAGIKELITYNDDGEPEGFQYERMTVVLLKAIQELTAEVETLKQRIK